MFLDEFRPFQVFDEIDVTVHFATDVEPPNRFLIDQAAGSALGNKAEWTGRKIELVLTVGTNQRVIGADERRLSSSLTFEHGLNRGARRGLSTGEADDAIDLVSSENLQVDLEVFALPQVDVRCASVSEIAREFRAKDKREYPTAR